MNGKGSHNGGATKKIVGIVQLAFAYLFEQIKLRKDRGIYYIIHVSYLEIYNEQVKSLFRLATCQNCFKLIF